MNSTIRCFAALGIIFTSSLSQEMNALNTFFSPSTEGHCLEQTGPTGRPLTIWFDTPTSLKGRLPWYQGKPELWQTDGYAVTKETMHSPTSTPTGKEVLHAGGRGHKPITAGQWGENEDAEWETQSLPIGNGSLGANIMGSIEAERITFNEKTLWRGGPNTAKGADYYWNVNKESAHLLPLIRQAFCEGNQQLAEELTRKNFNSVVPYGAADEEPFRFGSFTTMGEFYVETGLSAVGTTHYRRSLSLDSALVSVSFCKEGVNYRRRYFASYPHNVVVMHFGADQPGKQQLTLSYAPNPLSEGHMEQDGPNGLCFKAQLDNNGMVYTVRIRAFHKGGELSCQAGKLWVKDADEVTFLVTADTDYQINFAPDFTNPRTYVGVNPEATTAQWMTQASALDFQQLLDAHLADYQPLFQRVNVHFNPDLPNRSACSKLSTPARLKRYRSEKPDWELEELYYQYGRYLLIASSRQGNLPANLQGIWHNNADGPWRVDYHNNINLQMNYWPACSTALTECMWPLIDFIRMLQKPGERTAKAYFGARGWTASISGNIFGFTSPLRDEDMSWNFNPMAGPWLALHLWEYYDYTRDKDFLREIGYPLIRESVRFTVDYLWHKPDGTYTAAPSTSPEHGPIDEGATFVHAVAREILLTAIEASRTLGQDARERKQWQEVLDHLAPYRIGRYGQLMEWSQDIDDPEDHHRHVNHLFGLHPGHTVSPITTPELSDASKVVLRHRGDGATGWSMGWKLNQWARLHDGNHAYTLFGNLLKNGTADNLWDMHPPFQIDGNFGGTAGVTEMLLQSHAGFIHLLPALPDAWRCGEVNGLQARGNFTISIRWSDGHLTEAEIISHKGTPCSLRYGDTTLQFKTIPGATYRLRCEDGQLQLQS